MLFAASPFPLQKEKEQAEVGRSLTFSPLASASGYWRILREFLTVLQAHLDKKKELPEEF